MVKDNDGYESLEKGEREAPNLENKVKINTKCDDGSNGEWNLRNMPTRSAEASCFLMYCCVASKCLKFSTEVLCYTDQV